MEKTLNILLIEDDEDDIELLEDALTENNINFKMHVVTEGDKVAPYLETNELPDIILLDFNLPKVHGREILQIIKAKDGFNNVPLVVLTTSAAKSDVEFAYNMGAKQFLTKPNSIADFNSTINIIIESSKII